MTGVAKEPHLDDCGHRLVRTHSQWTRRSEYGAQGMPAPINSGGLDRDRRKSVEMKAWVKSLDHAHDHAHFHKLCSRLVGKELQASTGCMARNDGRSLGVNECGGEAAHKKRKASKIKKKEKKIPKKGFKKPTYTMHLPWLVLVEYTSQTRANTRRKRRRSGEG